ncbi:ERF family protein [Xanthobacter autotrophicus]|uniref:ERF family protein n=1 Tax=Xanthobacter autotrophicus TaxID=280 RepID=UPI0037272116
MSEIAYADEIDDLDITVSVPAPKSNVPATRQARQAPARRPAPRSSAKSDAGSILGAIMQAASNPEIDADKVARLMDNYRSIRAEEAKRAYLAALPDMQADLPTIDQNGRIRIEKGGVVIQETKYARWEDINEAIQPVLRTHGFGLSFRLSVAPDGKQNITAVLSHTEGHQEETTITLMHDSTGSKNSVQAVGSTISYGQRYTARALLNFQSRAREDRDDDGRAAGGVETVSEDQVLALRDLAASVEADEKRFCTFMRIDRLSDLPASRFDEAKTALERKRAK